MHATRCLRSTHHHTQGAGHHPSIVPYSRASIQLQLKLHPAFNRRVVAWEPVPLFRAYLAHAVALNNVTHLVQVGVAQNEIAVQTLCVIRA